MDSWREDDDINLCDCIAEQEIQDSTELIDFTEIDNGRNPEDNHNRWCTLLKGVGSIMPGMRFNPTNTAIKIKTLIETRDERYATAAKLHPKIQKEKTGFINIVDYFREHYKSK